MFSENGNYENDDEGASDESDSDMTEVPESYNEPEFDLSVGQYAANANSKVKKDGESTSVTAACQGTTETSAF